MPSLLTDYFQVFAQKANRPCLYYKTAFRTFTLTYEELFKAVHRTAVYYKELGLGKGDRVLLWGQNSPGWVIAFLACVLRGLIAVPLDIRGGVEFVRTIYELTRAVVIVGDLRHSRLLTGMRFLSFEELTAAGSGFSGVSAGEAGRLMPDDPVEILFTSGTTADPKGVVLSHRHLCSNVEALHEAHPDFGPDLKWLSVLPLSHVFEQTIGLWLSLRRGYSITYLEVLKASSLFEALENDRIDFVPVVPRLLRLMQGGIMREVKRQRKEALFGKLLGISGRLPLAARRFLFPSLKRKLGSLRHFVVGGAALDGDLELFWERLGVRLLQGYGLTETAPVISCNFPDEHRLYSIGKMLPGVEVKLGVDGEILVRGPNVFNEYYQSPEKTAEAFDQGWFRTGDVGEFDQDGFLYFKGRKKDVIVTAEGLNVYPEDLEAALHRARGVKEACVVQFVKDGREVIYAVLLLENPKIDPKAAVDGANAKLADYQKIQAFSVWPFEDFPRTSTMKIKKHEVIETLRRQAAGMPVVCESGEKVPRLFELVAALARMKPEQIRPEFSLGKDLGLTSVDRVELAAMIEEEFFVDADDDLLGTEVPLREIQTMIETRSAILSPARIPRWPAHPVMAPARVLLQEALLFPLVRAFCDIHVEDAGHLGLLNGPAIFIANHSSYFDAPVLLASLPQAVRRRIAIATWKEFFDLRGHSPLLKPLLGFGFLLASVGCNIYLFSQQKNFKKTLAHTGWLMDRGFHILFFPEGQRTVSGDLGEFQAGIGKLVTALRAPVMPVGLKGLFQVYPPQRKFPVRGPVTCRFGKPLSFSAEPQEAIVQKLRAEVVRLSR